MDALWKGAGFQTYAVLFDERNLQYFVSAGMLSALRDHLFSLEMLLCILLVHSEVNRCVFYSTMEQIHASLYASKRAALQGFIC